MPECRQSAQRWIVCLPVLMLACAAAFAQSVVPGLEVLLGEQKSLIEGKRVGLIANHTAVDRRMRHAADLLARTPGVRLTALFAPEHGIRGMVQAGGEVTDTRDVRTGVPVYSLYGETRRPTPAMLEDVDVLIFDIQDAGVRFYTYISTLGEGMAAAAEKGIPFIVLDRPNPLADTGTEGPILDYPRLKSFVGAYPIPIRYGLTIGELAGFIKDAHQLKLQLTVVKMENYSAGLWYDQTGLQWIAPSPNLPATSTATVYPGMCLFEGTNMSEGRGTTQPFEMVGAPWIDGPRLADELAALGLEGVLFRPAFFTPISSKHQGQACQGVQVHVTDRDRFRPVFVALHMLSVIKKSYPSEFQWRESAIDRLAGTDGLRRALDRGMPVNETIAGWQEGLKSFDAARRRYFLYPR
ncbi:MAG: DUF1343 domain-containing protein [Acidobacteria bacterium]|nr:DUF1343 domain-containing protein [Acidobacteriota bacterium]